MAGSLQVGRLVGLGFGALVLAGAIASVFLFEWRRTPPEHDKPVRPLNTLVVGDRVAVAQTYPARVRSMQEVTLAFDVPGLIRELPVVRGQRVSKGDVLARLDTRDFQSRLDAAIAEDELRRIELRGVTTAFERGAATQIEVSRASAASDLARAQRELAQKALEDATLVAPFDGIVADLFVDNFQNVAAGREVLRFQDTSTVRVEINVHESRVAFARRYEGRYRHAARFDFLPGRAYEATLVEYTTEADRATQTFMAIFEVETPEGVIILPGMTASIAEIALEEAHAYAEHEYLPVHVVGIDGDGRAFAWLVRDAGAGEATVHRADLELGEIFSGSYLIKRGVERGQRVAAAGVSHLLEGQRVRPVGATSEAGSR